MSEEDKKDHEKAAALILAAPEVRTEGVGATGASPIAPVPDPDGDVDDYEGDGMDPDLAVALQMYTRAIESIRAKMSRQTYGINVSDAVSMQHAATMMSRLEAWMRKHFPPDTNIYELAALLAWFLGTQVYQMNQINPKKIDENVVATIMDMMHGGVTIVWSTLEATKRGPRI